MRCCKSCVEEKCAYISLRIPARPTETLSFVSDFDLKKRIPVAPGDHRYKTIFPYIVYPSEPARHDCCAFWLNIL